MIDQDTHRHVEHSAIANNTTAGRERGTSSESDKKPEREQLILVQDTTS